MEPHSLNRYSRQVLYKGVGEAGQRRLLASRVTIVGCGALGTNQASLLVRAGVGRLRIIDRDYVEESNLQRQTLFEEQDAAQCLPKAVAAQSHLERANSSVEVRGIVDDLTPQNARELLGDAQVILDGTDNFETRYLLNDFSVKNGIPWIYGAAVGSYGVTLTIVPGQGPCLACVFPEPPAGLQATCDTEGILGAAASAVASWQVAEALKLIVGGAPHSRKLVSLDVWENRFQAVDPGPPAEGCRACQRRDFAYLAGDRANHITLCGRDSVQINESGERGEHRQPLDFAELERRLQPHGTVRSNAYVLRFSADPYEMTVFPDGRTIIKGTTDAAVARSLYARYISA